MCIADYTLKMEQLGLENANLRKNEGLYIEIEDLKKSKSKEVEDIKRKYYALQMDHAECLGNNQTLQEMLQTLIQEHEPCCQIIETLRREFQDLKHKGGGGRGGREIIKSLNAELVRSRSELAAAVRVHVSCFGDSAEMQHKFLEEKDAREKSQKDMRALEQEHVLCHEAIASVKEKLEIFDALKVDAQIEATRWREKTIDAETKKFELEREVSCLQNDVVFLKKSLLQVQEAHAPCGSAFELLKQELIGVQRECERVSETNMNMQKQNEAMVVERKHQWDEEQGKQIEAEAEVSLLKSELHSEILCLTHEHASATEVHAGIISDLQRQIVGKERVYSEIQDRLRESLVVTNEIHTEIVSLKNELHELASAKQATRRSLPICKGRLRKKSGSTLYFLCWKVSFTLRLRP